MLFVIDLDLLQVISTATDKRAVVMVEGKRGDDSPFEVIFVRSGITEALPASSVLTFGAKKSGKYDSAAVVLDSSFALTGSGTTAKYSARPSLNTTELNALFFIDSNDANDPAYIDLMAEFSWQVGAGAPTSSRTFIFRVNNDVLRDSELSPTALPTPIGTTAPVNEVSASATINPTGADNSILWTAVAGQGATGNSISISYAPTTLIATALTAAISGNAVTISFRETSAVASADVDWSLAIRYSKTLSGNTTFTFSNVVTAKVIEFFISQPGGAAWGQNFPAGITWAAGAPGVIAAGTTIKVTLTATSGSTFTGSFTTGATVVATSTASEVIAAAAAATAVAAKVTATASGTVTGAVAAITATNLTGGVTATASPPYIRTAGGFLYIQESGVWKKAALSTL